MIRTRGAFHLPPHDRAKLVSLPSLNALTAKQSRTVAAVPPENEWFTNLGNKGTRGGRPPIALKSF